MRKLKRYKPTPFKAKDSTYSKEAADYAVGFIECLCHTKGTWAGKPFELIDWQEQIIRDVFGTLKPNGYRQFNTAYIEIPKKMGKSELAAAVALLLTCGSATTRVPLHEIRYLEVLRNYVTVHADEKYTVKRTLKELEGELDESFYKIHRSYIVNLRFVKQVARTDVTLKDGTRLPLSGRAYEGVNRALIAYF